MKSIAYDDMDIFRFCCSIPGRCEAFNKEFDYVKHMWKNRKELKIEDAGIATLFRLECFAWFCAGEIIGRGFTFTHYKNFRLLRRQELAFKSPFAAAVIN